MFLEINSTTCSNVSFERRKKVILTQNINLDMSIHGNFKKLLSTTNIILLKQLSRFVSEVLSKF